MKESSDYQNPGDLSRIIDKANEFIRDAMSGTTDSRSRVETALHKPELLRVVKIL